MTQAISISPVRSSARTARRSLGEALPTASSRAGALILALLVLCAIGAPVISPYSPDAITPAQVLHGPGWPHVLGTDEFGRDVLSRLLYAYRVSLVIAACAIGISLPVGSLVGTLAGYFGKLTDVLLMRPVEMLLAVPALLLGLAMISILGAGTGVTILAISVIYIPVFARVVRASTQVVREELYVRAARTRGASHGNIMMRHVLPNALGPALVQATVLAGIAIQIEAALSYLGLGVQPPTPSLGSMLAEGQNFITQAPWVEISAGLALALTVLAFNLVGDGLREHLDPGGLSR